MADTFFGFDGSLSNLDDDDDGALCEPSEDEYDALNDETFGTICVDDSDDWEVAHEQLAQITENGRRKHSGECHDVEASLSQLVLDDGDDYVARETQHLPHPTPWGHAPTTQSNQPMTGMKNVCTVEELERQLRQQQTNQQQPPPPPFFPPRFPMMMQRPPGIQGPPFNSQNGQGPYQQQFGPNNNNGQYNPQYPQFSAAFGPHNNGGSGGQYPGPYGPNNNQFGANFPMAGPQHRPVGPVPLNGPPRPNFFGAFQPNMRHQHPPQDHQKPKHPAPGVVDKSLKHQQSAGRHQYPGAKPLTAQSLVQMIQSNHPMLNNNGLSGGLHNASQHPLLNSRLGGFNRNFQTMNGAALDEMQDHSEQDRDEYAGLMSSREKQWLLNIQMLQLSTGTPYIHDFYYTVFTDRKKQKEKEDVNEAHAANQKNHPFYSGGDNKRQRERHNSGRHSGVDENPQRVYVPTQFENSLGKLQSSSVTAPRKIIDVELVPGEVNASGAGRVSRAASVTSTAHETPREARRIKTLLLDIEALYCVLLRLEELRKPLAIADALVLKEREEKQRELEESIVSLEEMMKKLESTDAFLKTVEVLNRHKNGRDSPVVMDKRQVVSIVPSGPQTIVAKNLLDENKDELINKMFNGLLYDDKLKYIVAVRKGRTLLVRFLRCLESDQQSQTVAARLRSLWTHLLRALPRLARRNDAAVGQLYPLFRRFIWQSNGWSCILECSFALNQALDPARPPLALAVPLTLSCVCALLEKADTLVQTNEGSANERNWTKFLKNLARILKNCKATIAEPIQPLPSGLVTEHVKTLESRGTVEILKRGSLAGEFADLDRCDLSKQLLQHLCC